MCFIFFFNDTATTEIYTLSLHDALPISDHAPGLAPADGVEGAPELGRDPRVRRVPEHAGAPAAADLPRHLDRKSTRLNSSHANISYAVFCLKKKKSKKQ